MFRNMVTSLLDHERIYTTEAKAKELRRWADWMITLGKRGDLHARRQAQRVIRNKQVVDKLFTDLARRYQARNGGYTRSVKVGFRAGDGAPMSLIELMTGETAKKKKRKRKAPKTARTAPAADTAAPVPLEIEDSETVPQQPGEGEGQDALDEQEETKGKKTAASKVASESEDVDSTEETEESRASDDPSESAEEAETE